MSLKDQVEQAIKVTPNTSNSLSLDWESEPDNLVNFKAENSRLAKAIDGKLFVFDNVLIVLIITTNYSKRYTKHKLRSELQKLSINANNLLFERPLAFNLRNPRVGDVVTTKRFINQLQPGQQVTLDSDTDCFAVNSDLLECNGQPLRSAFKADFIHQFDSRCGSNNLPALTYTKFRLVQLTVNA